MNSEPSSQLPTGLHLLPNRRLAQDPTDAHPSTPRSAPASVKGSFPPQAPSLKPGGPLVSLNFAVNTQPPVGFFFLPKVSRTPSTSHSHHSGSVPVTQLHSPDSPSSDPSPSQWLCRDCPFPQANLLLICFFLLSGRGLLNTTATVESRIEINRGT